MHHGYRRIVFAIALTGMLSAAAVRPTQADDTTAHDTPRVALLELYTSEGCDSCPAADRWVSSLPRPRFVPGKLVVLAFHVDYWNDLGWVDRFSQRRFSERQQDLVRATGLRTAYTPQLILNGRDYRDFGGIETQVARSDARPEVVRLRLEARRRAATLHVTALVERVATANDKASLYVALYENNLETDVRAGENRGRRLRHDYVVRTFIGPAVLTPDKPTRWEADIAILKDWKLQDLGVAAFVENDRTREVLQATAQSLR